jgi:MFS family permease
MLSDRIGRKPTALISYGGVALSFSFAPLLLGPWKQMIRSNPYILLVGNVWLLFGGGVPVLIATLYSIAADVSTEQEK